MAVNVNRVRARDIEANINEIAILQVRFHVACSVHLTGNRKLRDNGLVHAGLEHNPGAIRVSAASSTWPAAPFTMNARH